MLYLQRKKRLYNHVNTVWRGGFTDNSTLSPLIIEEEVDAMSSGNEYDVEYMSKYMLEDICDEGQFYPSINRKEAQYKISGH